MSTSNADPYDPMSHLHCPSYDKEQNLIDILGNGRAVLRGMHPRLYICKSISNNYPLWLNTEMTIYGRIIQTYPAGSDPQVPSGTTYTTFRLASRSNHQAEYRCICNGLGYNSEFFLGGNCRLRKELLHHGPGLSHYANAAGTHMTFNLGQWVGHKFITKTTSNGVLLQTFVDYTTATNGGNWIKIMEYMDNGNWSVTGSELNGIDNDIASCGSGCIDGRPAPPGGPYNKVITRRGNSCYLRTDWVKDSVWTKFSIREI